MTVFTSFTRASFLNMRADQSSSWLIRTSFPLDHFVTILPSYSLFKMSKHGNNSPLFKILFFRTIWIYLRLIFCTVQIKDSCTVDIENRRFYLLFLRLIQDFASDWLQQKMLHFVCILWLIWRRRDCEKRLFTTLCCILKLNLRMRRGCGSKSFTSFSCFR